MMHPRAKQIRQALKGLPFEFFVSHNKLHGYTSVGPRFSGWRDIGVKRQAMIVGALMAAGYEPNFHKHGCGHPGTEGEFTVTIELEGEGK